MSIRQFTVMTAAVSLVAVAFAQDSETRLRNEETRTEVKSKTRTAKERNATDQNLAEQLGWQVAATDDGPRIERIVKNSAIARAHLQEGDRIVKVGGENVNSTERLTAILDNIRNSEATETEIIVLRDGEELSYLLSLESVNPATETAPTRTTSTTSSANGDLVQMIQQLQMQNRKQQETLETILLELQDLRSQMGGAPVANEAVFGTETRIKTEAAPGLAPTNPRTTNPATNNRPGASRVNP